MMVKRKTTSTSLPYIMPHDLICCVDNRYSGGRNEVSGTLHWGPDSSLDSFWRTSGVSYMTRGDYSDDYHVFGMEWSETYIYTWVDTRLAVRPLVIDSTICVLCCSSP